MRSVPSQSAVLPQTVSQRAIPLRRLALPTEHGGWGFLGEPLVAGLAIAFSPAAPWIAAMTVGAFLMRQPLRLLITNKRARPNSDLRTPALSFLLLYFTIFAGGLAGTLISAGAGPLLPFFIALPFILVQAYFDIFRRSRALIPEVAGAVSISASIAAVALADGFTWQNAGALWLVFIARLIPSILYVRERLRIEKGKEHSVLIPFAAHLLALAVVVILSLFGLIPVLIIAPMTFLLVRAITGLSSKRKTMRAMQIGIWEVVYGTAMVLILVIGFYYGL